MARARVSRTMPAPLGEIWELVSDAHHMPRWWPQVARMESVEADRFTQVFMTKKGRPVRVDFHVSASEEPHRRVWEQEIIGTPFERVLAESVIEIQLEPDPGAAGEAGGAGTKVTLAQQQRLRGYSRTGGFLLRRATRKRLEEALDGLEQIVG